jgi:hypothetical protein
VSQRLARAKGSCLQARAERALASWRQELRVAG